MKNLLTIAFFFTFSCVIAQYLPNYNFGKFETIPCPFDPTVNIKAYEDWRIYQTIDGKWDGQIDSSHCISLASTSANGISLQGADLDKPIFVRCLFTDDNKILLEKNSLYSATAYEHWQSNEVSLTWGMNCPGNLCSGLIVGIEIPDSTGMATDTRWFTDIPSTNTNHIFFETCVPVEYFDNSYLREFIIKMTVAPGTMPEQNIKLTRAYFGNYYGTNHISEIIAPPSSFADTSYRLNIREVSDFSDPWAGENFLLLYNDLNSWPSSNHPAYVEGRPLINTPDPQTIDLTVDEYQFFVPQPFAFIRGGLVEGSDSIRHKVNLINYGGDVCLGGPIDFVFDGGTKYIHGGGHLNFEGRSACMMFKNGAALEVADNTLMQYGIEGKGILALRPGSTIRLRKGSTLLIDNLLWLQGIPTKDFPDDQIYMALNLGSTLSFGENASIFNGLSINENTRLNIYMNGGTLDDNNLSTTDKNLINKIYPKPKANLANNFLLLQNPIGSAVELQYYSDRDETVAFELHDLQGRVLWTKLFYAKAGDNFFRYEMDVYPSGIYVVTLMTKRGRIAMKVVKGG